VAGITGILLVVVGVTAALLENNGVSLEYVTLPDVLRALAKVLILLASAILVVVWAAKLLVSSKVAHPFVDQSTQDKSAGYTALRSDLLELVGLEAEAVTDLRPVGHIYINGKQYDAEANEGYIGKGQRVIVERVKSLSLIVKKQATT
jgi:membrane-bound serine protease (ClpP class)